MRPSYPRFCSLDPGGRLIRACLVWSLLFCFSAWPLLACEIALVSPAKAGLSENKLSEVNQFMDRLGEDPFTLGFDEPPDSAFV
jgi:hypothetical protein